jgi:thymidylate synthase
VEIDATSPLEAWRLACAHLVKNGGDAFCLRVTFPGADTEEGALLTHDPRMLLGDGHDRARDVANTIFPAKSWSKAADRSDLYKRYLRAHRRRSKGSWGTYFERMIRFGQKEINQLERVTAALSTWKNTPKAALVIHLSSAETDVLKPLGSPCLQYVQFCCPSASQLDVIAVYRNHDYCNKVLGNYVGLRRLLRFVADESGRTPNTVSVLSIHAYYQASGKSMKILADIKE